MPTAIDALLFLGGKAGVQSHFRMIGYFWEDATMAVEGDRLEIINKSGKAISVLSPAVIEAHNFWRSWRWCVSATVLTVM